MEKIPLHVRHALNLINNQLREIGNNAGFNDKLFERRIYTQGWRAGASWCGYFVGDCLNAGGVTNIKYRGGLARNYTKNVFFYNDSKKIKQGDLIVWQKGATTFGHIGIILEIISDGTLLVAEGNTSAGGAGSQSNGDGAYQRTRKIDFINTKFHVLGFVDVDGKY